MKRAGFTMIELVFVIVILGILAAVAVPKLAATRTDAKVASAATDLSTVISDMAGYYTSQGTLAKLSTMTNVASFDDPSKGATKGDIAYFEPTQDKECIKFTFNNIADGNVTLSPVTGGASADTSSLCAGLIADANASIKNYIFGGTGVKH